MNRDGVKKLLHSHDWDEVARLASLDRRIVRTLLGLLYDADDYTHWLAVEAIGRVGAVLAEENEEKARELIRRLLWNLNDESGGTPWGSTGAIGAIIAARPDVFEHYLSIISPFHADDSICPEFIWSLVTVGRVKPTAASEFLPLLLDTLRRGRLDCCAYAAWGAGVLGVRQAIAPLGILRGNTSPVAVYCGNGVYRRTTLGKLAAESLDRIATGTTLF